MFFGVQNYDIPYKRATFFVFFTIARFIVKPILLKAAFLLVL